MASPSSGQTGHSSPAAVAGGVGEGEPPPIHAYRIADVCRISGLGRTSIYAAIKSGQLVARKWRRCTIVLGSDLVTFLNDLPKVG
jgi:hypothetical protein